MRVCRSSGVELPIVRKTQKHASSSSEKGQNWQLDSTHPSIEVLPIRVRTLRYPKSLQKRGADESLPDRKRENNANRRNDTRQIR